MTEEWRPIAGYEGLYEISNLGRVKSLERIVTYTRRERNGRVNEVNQHVKEHIVKQGRRHDGYADVPLSRNGVTTLHVVHRLIAQAWIPNPNNYRTVNHIDGDPSNNSLSNLEWTNDRQNNLHAVQHFMRSQCIPVYCEETQKVYASLSQADRELELTKGSAHAYIKQYHSTSKLPYHFRLATKEEIQQSKDYANNNNDQLSYKQNIPVVINPTERSVKCLDTSQVFVSISELARKLGVSTSAVEASIRDVHCCKGYTFRYVEDLPEHEQNYLMFVRSKSKYNRGVSYWRHKDLNERMPEI